MAITTLEQAIQAIEVLQVELARTNGKVNNLQELSEEQLAAAQQALGESTKAVEYARNMYRVDHYGYIWKWNTETHQYEKTTSRICTPVIADEAVTTDKLAVGAVTTDKIAEEAVTTEKIGNGQVKSVNIDAGAVTNDKIVDGAVTNEKIANATIEGEKFIDNSIDGSKIKDNSVPGSKIADGSIESVDIKDNTLEGSKLVDNTIDGSKIKDNQIESRHLLDNSIPGEKIKDGTIENVDIKDGTLDGAKIKDNTIQSGKLADGAVTEDKLVDNSVTTAKIASNAVTEDKIADDSVTTAKIANSAVSTGKIADEAVTEDKLAPQAVTTDKLADGVISEIENITDAVPTAGSVKPVQSGAVFKELYGEGEKIILDNLTWTDGYINPSGNIASPSGAYKYSNVIPVSKGETVACKISGNGICAIALYSSSETTTSSTLLAKKTADNASQQEFSIVAGQDCYARFSYNSAADGAFWKLSVNVGGVWQALDTLEEDISETNDNVSALDGQVEEIEELINDSEYPQTTDLSGTLVWVRGYLTASGGVRDQSSGNYYYSEPIPVEAGDILRCHVGGQGIGVICLYSSSAAQGSSFIEGKDDSHPVDQQHPHDYELVCSVGGYVRFCYKVGDVSNESFSKTVNTHVYSVLKSVRHLTIAAWNFGLFNHGVQTEGQIAIPDDEVDEILPLLKQQFVNIRADILYSTEYSKYVNRSGTMDTYDTLLKQFYPYKYITGDKGSALFSKYPISVQKFISLDSRTYLDGKIYIDGKEIRVFLMHPRSLAGQEGVNIRVADINQVITYLEDSDYVIIAGDMNTYEVSELDSFKNNGYTCGNCGYQGNINTYPDVVREWYIDNVIVKGFNMDNFVCIENTSVSDHYPVKAEISAFL